VKWDIIHRTQYTYASAVRESFNEVRLQPFSNEAQKVDRFILKVLPAVRLRHHRDFYSNVVHHFEIPEPHNSLLVESNLQVTTQPIAPLAESMTPWPLAKINDAQREARTFDFLQHSRFVDLSPETWRLAVDATDGIVDTWQAALGGNEIHPLQFQIRAQLYECAHPRPRCIEGATRCMPGFCTRDDRDVSDLKNSHALRERLFGNRNCERHTRVGGGFYSWHRLARC
jgi:hypothetical protein